MNSKINLKGKSVLLICLSVFIINLFFSLVFRLDLKTSNYKTILEGNDAKGYYEYLPWLFNNKDINYTNDYSYPINESRALKYPYGTALLQSPFYGISQLFSSNSKQENNLNYTDALLICIGASFYISLALTFLWKLLERLKFSNSTKYITIIAIYLGTNLFHYSIMEPMMSHLYSFFCISMFLYFFVAYNQSQEKKYEYSLYLFAFLIIAIRQFNFIFILPLLIFQAYYLQNLKIFIKSILVIILSYIVQLMFWKLQSGAWILKPYNGENFFYWTNPQFINVLFSFRKGLFVYSPILLLALSGLIIGLRTNLNFKSSLIITLSIFTYFIACWWHWPFGDSFGHRAFIDCYAMFAIGTASLFELLKNKLLKICIYSLTILFISLNLLQTWQYNNGILLSEYMNFQKYKYQFLYVDDASKNCLGGVNDISSFNKNNGTDSFLIPNVNFDFTDFSKPFAFKNKLKSKIIFLEINFTKHELSPNQSNKAKLFIEMKDELNTKLYQTAFLINETPNDCETANKKTFSYQIKLPTRDNCDSVVLFFSNPQRKKFDLTQIKVRFNYSQ